MNDFIGVILGVLGLVLTLFGVGFTAWAFIVRQASNRFSEQMLTLIANQDKMEAKIDGMDKQLKRTEENAEDSFKGIRKDVEVIREKVQQNVNYQSNRITKLEAHAELTGKFTRYTNGHTP
jgi:predicted  nucleic acid-binding Zn-ribbon protein